MVIQRGMACAPSAGGRNTSVYGRNRSRMTGLWQKSEPGLHQCIFISVVSLFCAVLQYCRVMLSLVKRAQWACQFTEDLDDWTVFVTCARLQREEEAAFAISQGSRSESQAAASQTHPPPPSLGPFSKFEEKKTNEKTRKVTTVKKFFSSSSSRTPKKGMSSFVWAGQAVMFVP